jgi:hypothetical protein
MQPEEQEEERSVLISLRLHRGLVQQIDNLHETFCNDASLAPSGSTSRSEIIRHLLLLGIKALKDQG